MRFFAEISEMSEPPPSGMRDSMLARAAAALSDIGVSLTLGNASTLSCLPIASSSLARMSSALSLPPFSRYFVMRSAMSVTRIGVSRITSAAPAAIERKSSQFSCEPITKKGILSPSFLLKKTARSMASRVSFAMQ